MKVVFRLGWAKGDVRKSFKSSASYDLFSDYLGRTGHFDRCEAAGPASGKKPGTRRWLCHTGHTAKPLSSEALAEAVQGLRNSGVKEWEICVGPADGFTAADAKALEPDFLWSFGPMTYPHELAAVIAAEQVYRAYAIIHRLPYHGGH